jgi:UDP-N-acetylglucosamine/UDP-N-acetylgalactosamine diphosphorylase
MYDVGLISHKTIFQLHIERIMKIRSLTAAHNPSIKEEEISIPIYIMTSDLNHHIITSFFKDNNYFNYPEKDIYFFEQGLEPCFTFDGKIIIDSPTSMAMAPDGNGGVYKALSESGCVADMEKRGIKYLHFYGIDNILTKALDPIFFGVCIDKQIECGNKIVWRANKGEKVGVTVENNGKMTIIEYSEIPPDLAEVINDKDGRLLFGAANICNHFLSFEFLKQKVIPNIAGIYHIANKKIPYYDFQENKVITPSKPNGIKLEMFIFDVFPLSNNWIVCETSREDEFAPVKNEPGNSADSPDTARALISLQAMKWLKDIGSNIVNSDGSSADCSYTMLPLNSPFQLEVSPLLSYSGEGLEEWKNKIITLPAYLK